MLIRTVTSNLPFVISNKISRSLHIFCFDPCVFTNRKSCPSDQVTNDGYFATFLNDFAPFIISPFFRFFLTKNSLHFPFRDAISTYLYWHRSTVLLPTRPLTNTRDIPFHTVHVNGGI